MAKANLPRPTGATPARLREHGLRPTRIRLVVYELLTAAQAPLSHADIMKRLPKLHSDRVTVYRALDGLVAHGLVHRVAFPDRVQRFAAGALHAPQGAPAPQVAAGHDHGDAGHAHFICNRCAATLCVSGPAKLAKQLRSWLPKPYTVTGLDILLYGLCPDCRQAGY